MDEIKAIFFDTSVLDRRWPSVSAKVEVIMSAAKRLGISIHIPSPVQMELEKHWRNNGKTLLEDLGSFSGKLELANTLDWNSLRSAYEKAVDCLTKQWAIQFTPHPKVPASELFEQANTDALCFEDGQNFKDAIIYHSVVESLAPQECGLLICNDNDFLKAKEKLRSHARRNGRTVEIVNAEDASKLLVSKLPEAVAERYAKHKVLAKAAMMAFLPKLEIMLNESVNRRVGGVVPGLMLRRGVTLKDVDIDVAVVTKAPTVGQTVRISAIVRGEAHRLVALDYTGESTAPLNPFRGPFEAGVTATATFDGKAYRDIQIQAMTYGSGADYESVQHAKIQDVPAVGGMMKKDPTAEAIGS